MLTIGDKIRNLRKSHSHSQEDLSELLKVTRQAISKWENNVSLPDIYTLKNLSGIYKVPLDFFNDSQNNEYEIKPTQQSNDLFAILSPYGRIILVIGNIMSGIFLGPLSLIVSVPSLLYSFKKKQILEIVLCMALVLIGSNQLFTIMFGRESVPHRINISASDES